MAAYLIKEDFEITRQQGDISEIVFVVQNTLLLTGMTVKFSVYDSKGVAKITKVSPTTITVVAQTITIPLLKADTETINGALYWEMELTDANRRITIGKGRFNVVKTLIP